MDCKRLAMVRIAAGMGRGGLTLKKKKKRESTVLFLQGGPLTGKNKGTKDPKKL